MRFQNPKSCIERGDDIKDVSSLQIFGSFRGTSSDSMGIGSRGPSLYESMQKHTANSEIQDASRPSSRAGDTMSLVRVCSPPVDERHPRNKELVEESLHFIQQQSGSPKSSIMMADRALEADEAGPSSRSLFLHQTEDGLTTVTNPMSADVEIEQVEGQATLGVGVDSASPSPRPRTYLYRRTMPSVAGSQDRPSATEKCMKASALGREVKMRNMTPSKLEVPSSTFTPSLLGVNVNRRRIRRVNTGFLEVEHGYHRLIVAVQAYHLAGKLT
ncbi:hypothetical protein CYMTET_53165 [Cymbomonas tetramitiformis]|uniref:Uncharacterized protein n=1 Tax=Cymbomonas tetramitiformis TaxID=36881 RepID=A0AAE0EQM0_9CHLO|nr:hypothetical protein CYMTET_53165 [Cymbomonas tetramitiformis]